ncbi:hypothetical protein BDR04DRAFT_476931 [Suillus decipiens]|nr:hypothetical protein BDR04DRAFT_476931 [Suillus decipiens]
MESIEAGAHRLDNGTTIYVCDCSACLHKTGGRNLQVSKATYFRHKPSRLASLPPVPLNIAPDLPSPDLPHVPVPAESSSSKRLQADLDDEEVRSRKKGRSDSPELAPSFEPEPQSDDSSRVDNDTTEEFYQDDSLEYGAVPENFPDEALPDGPMKHFPKISINHMILSQMKNSPPMITLTTSINTRLYMLNPTFSQIWTGSI